MNLEHSFTVPVPVERAWEVLLDVEQVAPCMPGATLESADGDEFTGQVKVKVGPISLTYKGSASIVSADEQAREAVVSAHGKTRSGAAPGTAAATVTMRLTDLGPATGVDLRTELKLTGRQAQLGRNVINDVAGSIIQQFADALAERIAGEEQPPEDPSPARAPRGGDLAGQRGEMTVRQISLVERAQRPAPATGTPPAASAGSAAPVNVLGTAGRSALRLAAAAVRNALRRLFRRRPPTAPGRPSW
jgi:uncharacterized protein